MLLKIRWLADPHGQFLEPLSLGFTVNDAAEESQALGDVVAVGQNVLARSLRVLPDELLEASGLRKNISRMTSLRHFDDNAFFKVEDVLVAKQVHRAGPPGQLLVIVHIVVGTPGNLDHIEIARQAEIPAPAAKLIALCRDLLTCQRSRSMSSKCRPNRELVLRALSMDSWRFSGTFTSVRLGRAVS